MKKYHLRRGLINVKNIDDNECFKWCLVRYLHPADHHPPRITKADKNFANELDFKDIKFAVKIRDFHKTDKKNSTHISVFGYEKKRKISNLCVKKYCEDEHIDLLLIGEEGKKHYVHIKSIHCMISLYIVEENTFVVIVYKVLEKQKPDISF